MVDIFVQDLLIQKDGRHALLFKKNNQLYVIPDLGICCNAQLSDGWEEKEYAFATIEFEMSPFEEKRVPIPLHKWIKENAE
jgi:hypothetical protein